MSIFGEWLNATFYNNSVGAYLQAAFNFAVIYLILVLFRKLVVKRLGQLAQKTANDLDDFVVSLIGQIGSPFFLAAAFYLAAFPLQLDARIRTPLRYAVIVVLTLQAVLIIQKAVQYTITKSYRTARPNDPSAHLVTRNIILIVEWAIWALGAVFILDNLGVNISALVAGLGIGGVAVAMASQAVLGDLFSALSIFIDKPFEVGDFIIVDDKMGTVEYIGLKTTRLRSLSGEQLVFSNSDLTKSRIQNYKRMDSRRVLFRVGVVYQTSLDQLRKIPEWIRQIFGRLEGVRLDRAHFASFGDSSLVYEVVYFVESADYNVYMDKQQTINFSLKEIFEREGVEFAYPTQTLYLSGDENFKKK